MKTWIKLTYAACLGTLAWTPSLMAQNNKGLQLPADARKAPAVVVPKDTVTLSYLDTLVNLPVAANCDYTLQPEFPEGTSPWFTVSKESDNRVRLLSQYGYNTDDRFATLRFNLPGGTSNAIVVRQTRNRAAAALHGDMKLTVVSASANQQQSGEGIEKTYDGNTSTIYHSPYSEKTQFPVTLTYTLNTDRVDYLVYTPRQDGGANGNFGHVTILYSTQDEPNNYTEVRSMDFGQSSSTTLVTFSDPLQNVAKIRFSIDDGYNNYASCAEMEFFQTNQTETEECRQYFTDPLCTQLKPGITAEVMDSIANPFAKMLVACFEPYENIQTLATRLKTSTYNRYENPTGIFFEPGEPVGIFVDGLGEGSASLIIKDFESEEQPESTYALHDGLNVIDPRNVGHGYVSYYSDNWQQLPDIRMHFVMAKVNGYFDLERGDTDEYWQQLLAKYWQQLLANKTSGILDIRTPRVQAALPKDKLLKNTPKRGRDLATNYENLVTLEHQLMGLQQYGVEPKNRQFVYVNYTGGIFAGGLGASCYYDGIDDWCKADIPDEGWWGLAHELGHVNQVRPGLKWLGTSEVTNNIHSAWVQFKLGQGWYRLESEVTGINDYSGMQGGRFNAYLESGVRKGQQWLLQEGPDKQDGDNTTVEKVDYDGNPTGETVTVKARGGDFFVRLAPMWQLQLYCHQAGYSPDIYAKLSQAVRNMDDSQMTDGQLQINFMKMVCDTTGMNFLPFFETAGMLKPIAEYIADYGSNWMMISQEMIDELKSYVKEKEYPEPEAAVNFISAYNWQTYRDRASVKGTLNSGCTPQSQNNRTYIRVDHNIWQNVVAFKTYDADGNLLRITGIGLGCPDTSHPYTLVLWPQTGTEKAAYINAVAWDGTETECYRP